MDNIQQLISEWLLGVFSLGMMYYSFMALNQCTKHTNLKIRLPLIVFLGGGVGACLLALSDVRIHWSYTLVVIGITVYLSEDRRLPKTSTHRNLIHKV